MNMREWNGAGTAPARRRAAAGGIAAILAAAQFATCVQLPAVLRDTGSPPGAGATAGPGGSGDAEVDAFVVLLDAHRRARGCPSTAFDATAAAVAHAHADDMRRRGYFSHTTPEDLSPFDRLRAGGVRFRAAAENIAFGQATGRAVFDSWLRSEGHRRNLENCSYTHHGVGRSGTYWTHVLFAP
jgi:uncharacterized protein YkwD